MEPQHRLAQSLDQRKIVGSHHDGRAAAVKFLKKVHQAIANSIVEASGRLVGNQQVRAPNHRTGDGNPLLLTSGKGAWGRVQFFGQAHPSEKLLDLAADLLFPFAREAKRQRHVVEDAQVIDQAEILKDDADPTPKARPRIPAQMGYVPAKKR